MRSAGLLLAAVLAVGSTACAGMLQKSPAPEPTPTEAATAVIVVEATPAPVRTPLPPFDPTPFPNNGQMLTRFDSYCAMGQFGPEITIRYTAEILEGTAEIARVQVLVDGHLTEDSGLIANQIYTREVRYGGGSNRLHQLEYRVTVRGNEVPRVAISFVRCPRAPDELHF